MNLSLKCEISIISYGLPLIQFTNLKFVSLVQKNFVFETSFDHDKLTNMVSV
jgi:hypothetical protein